MGQCSHFPCSTNGYDQANIETSAKRTENEVNDSRVITLLFVNLVDLFRQKKIGACILSYLSISDISCMLVLSKSFRKLVTFIILASKSLNFSVQTKFHWKFSFTKSYSKLEIQSLSVTVQQQRNLVLYAAFVDIIHVRYLYRTESDFQGKNTMAIWEYLSQLKSCTRVKCLRLGCYGIVSDISLFEFHAIIKRLGKYLIELHLIKLSYLTSETMDIIAHYCPKLLVLTLFGCENLYRNQNGSENGEYQFAVLLDRFGATLTYLDIRYSIDIHDVTLDIIYENMKDNSSLQVILGSRHSNETTSCRCWEGNVNNHLSQSKWTSFVSSLRHALLLAIDDYRCEILDTSNDIRTKIPKLYINVSAIQTLDKSDWMCDIIDSLPFTNQIELNSIAQ